MLRTAIAITASLALLGIALGAFFGARALVSSEEDPVERAKEATALDNLKPWFEGQMGDFVVARSDTMKNYPCAEPYQPGANPERSELYFKLPGATIERIGSCQGTVISITASIPSEAGSAMAGRVYFLGTPGVPFEAPAERLKLFTVGGKPAIAELPVPDNFLSDAKLIVIERVPASGRPGILTWAYTINDLPGAIKLAEQIMGVTQ